MINVSAFFYGASPYLTGQASDVPVFGGAWDGAQEWAAPDNNLFNSGFVPDYDDGLQRRRRVPRGARAPRRSPASPT